MSDEADLRNPTHGRELRRRREMILRARSSEPVRNRNKYLRSIARSKRVLDVGIVDHLAESAKSPDWLHRALAEAAAYCVGVDVLEIEVEKLQAQGWNVQTLDITRDRLEETFDLIVCGEIIEHVSNPGGLLENCRAMLAPGGRLLITAPNPWFLTIMLKNSFGRDPYLNNVDHVSWFDPTTLTELGLRHGLQLNCYRPLIDLQLKSMRARIVFALASLLSPWLVKPEVFAVSLIYDFARVEEPPSMCPQDVDN